jgi:hypothetical protein
MDSTCCWSLEDSDLGGRGDADLGEERERGR